MEENNNRQNDNNQNNGRKSPNRNSILILVLSIVLALLFFNVYRRFQAGQREEISYSQFMDMLKEGTIDTVKIYSSTIEVIPKEKDGKLSNKSYYTNRISDINLVDRLEKAKSNGELDYKAMDTNNVLAIPDILRQI